MKIWRVLSMFFIVGFLFKMTVEANDTMKQEQFIASFSGALQKCVLQQRKITIVEDILNSDKWSHIYWPSYDDVNKSIYFVAKSGLDQSANVNIYSFNLLAPNQEPKKMIDNARHPSLSPDKNLLAYYRHPNQLWIQSLGYMKAQKLVSDMANYQPCVWISNTHLLYIDLANELVLLDVLKGETQRTGYGGVVPGALSPDGKRVLCGSGDGMKIYFFLPLSNELKLIKENKYRSMGTSFIWLSDGSGFLFTMQTWSNILRFNESRDLFLYILSDQEETLLLRKIALFGGALIP